MAGIHWKIQETGARKILLKFKDGFPPAREWRLAVGAVSKNSGPVINFQTTFL